MCYTTILYLLFDTKMAVLLTSGILETKVETEQVLVKTKKKSKFIHRFLKLQPCEVFDLSVRCRYILYLSYDVRNVVLVTSCAEIYAFE